MKRLFPKIFAALVLSALPAFSGERETTLLGFSLSGPQGQMVRAAASESFELAGGENFELKSWYSPRFPNLSAVFQTQLSNEVSLIWGGSTGEAGQKYAIGPTVNFGFSFRREVMKNGTFQIDLMGTVGAAMREETCVGDYGDLGGVQVVNCRLAASILPPQETLTYLWNSPASANAVMRIAFTIVF